MCLFFLNQLEKKWPRLWPDGGTRETPMYLDFAYKYIENLYKAVLLKTDIYCHLKYPALRTNI